jgi:anti-sigma-K factor RskA
MNTLNQEAPERQEIEALLPWHAAGTLSRRDAERVERALSGDRELARRFELVREELNETIHLNESLGHPSSRAAEKLFAAIDAEGGRAPARRSFDLAGRVAAFLSSFSPRTVAYAAAAAALVLLVQSAVVTSLLINPGSGDMTLMSAPSGQGTRVVVRFTPNATSSDITKFLDVHKAEMIGGPKKGSLYTLRLTAPGLPKDEIAKIIRQMQSESKIVEFVAAKE